MRWRCTVALIFISANPTSARSLVGYEQREQSGAGVDGEQPSVHVDLEVSGGLSRRRITSDETFAKAADGGASVAVTCRGVDDCGGGAGAEVTSSPDKDAAGASSTISEGNHDDAEHEVATRPGVASTADFFAGGAIQTNLPNVASSESVAAATSGAQQEQAAGDVSAAFSPESISELLAQLEARKKDQDDDRLCNTEKEQECYQPCKDRNDCAQESGDEKEECKQMCRAKCCKAKDKNLHLFTKNSASSSQDKKGGNNDSSKRSEEDKKKKKRSSAASEFERMCNTAPERKCREKCFQSKSCGSDSQDDETCKKKCRSKCCGFSRNKAKQGGAIKAANERLCNTAAERSCRKECFEAKNCGNNDDDCKKKCRFKCCYEDDRLCNTEKEKERRNECFEQEGCTGSNDQEDRNCMAICRYQNCEFEDSDRLCNLQSEVACRDQCISDDKCGEDEDCIKRCRFKCCDDDSDRLCNTIAEKEARNTCFLDSDCKESDEDCQRLCRFRSCEREDDKLCNTIPERSCRTNCIIKEKCREEDEHCIKMCRLKCCEDENDRLCNFVGEKQCRQECLMQNSCDDDDSDCLRSCRVGCCEDEEADVLCNRSEEKLCKAMCVVQSRCDDDDTGCQKKCRDKCCKKSDKSKSSSSEFSEFCDTEGEVRCRQICYDAQNCSRDDKECRAECRNKCCDEDNDNLEKDSGKDGRNEPAPTPRPTSSSETLCNGITRKQRARVVFMRLSLITDVENIYSDGEIDMETPQGQAYKWILSDDDRVLCPLDTTLEQRYVLAVLYYSTNGDVWTDNDKWLSESSECSWVGVGCNFRGEIDTIELQGFNLDGELPSELQALKLDILGLEDNKLSGRLLETFNDGLVRLRLSNNRLTGEVPSTLPLSLVALYLASNELEGTLDGVIGSLPNMRQIQLQDNKFTGRIPDSLREMENLRIARFEDNRIEGSMPPEVCDMKSSNSGLAVLSVDCEAVDCDCCIPECTE